MTKPSVFTVAPNDFLFLFESCRRCFFMKHKEGVRRPQTAFPSILGRWAAAQANYFVGRSTRELSQSLPDGVVRYAERFVESIAFDVPGHDSKLIIRGRIDLGLEFANSTFGLVDLKTAKQDPSLSEKYFAQVGFYCLALENPAPGRFGMSPITQMGLKVLTPTSMSPSYGGLADYGIGFDSLYLPIQRDDDRVVGLLIQILDVLDQPDAPPPNDKCSFCRYRS